MKSVDIMGAQQFLGEGVTKKQLYREKVNRQRLDETMFVAL